MRERERNRIKAHYQTVVLQSHVVGGIAACPGSITDKTL